MESPRSISLVFALIIFLLIGLGGFSLYYLNTIAVQAENLYNHPYRVSNAARNINIHLVSMHRYMKDVALAEDGQQIQMAASLVDKHEQQVQKNFDVVFEHYLGKRSDIQSAYKAFIDWKVIRDQVIHLKTQGNNKAAADITRTNGADHVSLLNRETQKLIDYADAKAKTFINNAADAKSNAFRVVTALLAVTVLTSILSSYYAVRRLDAAQVDTKKRIHLIDQNILMAKFDDKGIVLDISNHLCRYLEVTKDEVIGEQANFFINDDTWEIQPEHILKITATGKIWEGEIRRVSSDGAVQWIRSSVHPELDDDYTVVGYTNIILDITDRKAVEELSITDPLTTLHNRRHFDDVIEKAIKIASRNGTSMTFAIIDVDYFKKYNDHYGHAAGDSVLVRVSEVLKRALRRPNDYVFRLGGEEFGVLFFDVDPEQSFEFLETLRQGIEDLKIEHDASDVCKYLTVSGGAHITPGGHVLNSNQLYVKADEALYKAKARRNNVVVT